MRFQLIGNHLSPAEGEVTVRAYHCTALSPAFAILGLKINSYLAVTNKRVVYFAQGSSAYGAAGTSQRYTEVPLADVTNISLGKGTRFSLLRLILGILLGFITSSVIASVCSFVTEKLDMAPIGNHAYLFRFCLFLQLSAACYIVIRSRNVSRESVVRIILASIGLALLLPTFALTLARQGVFQQSHSFYGTVMLILSVPLFCYWLWCLYWFVRHEYLKMAISAKTNWPPSIQITGVSWWSRINITANLADFMAPAIDADALFKELGAMVTDMQTLGDQGIQKWKLDKPDGTLDADQAAHAVKRPINVLAYTFASMVVIGLFVGAESINYASVVKKENMLQVQHQIADLGYRVRTDASIQKWAPKQLTTAELEARAGDESFAKRNDVDAMAHWNAAKNIYTNLPFAAAMNAYEARSKQKTEQNKNVPDPVMPNNPDPTQPSPL